MIYNIITALIVLAALAGGAIKIYRFFKDKNKKNCKSCPYKSMCQANNDIYKDKS